MVTLAISLSTETTFGLTRRVKVAVESGVNGVVSGQRVVGLGLA